MPAPTVDNVERPRAFGFGVALGERLFRLAVAKDRPLTIVTAPLEAPRVNTMSSAEEATADDRLIYSRSRFDGGEGLYQAHTQGAAPNRFWDSAGVSVNVADPDEFPEVRLLHDTTMVGSSSGINGLRTAYDTLDDALYVCEGAMLRRTDNPTATTPIWTTEDPAAAEAGVTQVHDVAVLGSEVFAALGANGIHKKTGGTWAHWSDTPATRIWSVKGRIVASNGASLYEVTTAGAAPTATIILPSGESFNDVADGGNAVLAAATDGYVYAFTTDTGSLVLSSQTLFESEQVTALAQTQGVVGVGTKQGNIGRFYTGVLNEAGQIVEQQLIRQFGASNTSTSHAPLRIIGTRASMLIGVNDGVASGLWRYDLITGGIARNLSAAGVTGPVRGIEALADRVFFTVDGVGMYAEGTTYVSVGYLIGPLGDFYSAKAKSWVSAALETGELTGGMTVELFYTSSPEALLNPNSAAWVRVTRRDSGEGDPGDQQISPVVSRYLAGMVKLRPSGTRTATPAVRSFSFRAYPSSGDEDRIVTFPVNVSDQIERRGRRRVRVKGRGHTEYEALRAVEGRPTTVQFFKPQITFRGLVEEVGVPILAETRRGSSTLVAQVRFRGQIVGLNITSGAGPLGTDLTLGSDLAFGESP